MKNKNILLKTKTSHLIELIKAHKTAIFLFLCIILFLATRLPHLWGPIDNPHSWRQCDTAQYAYSYYKDGIDILKPSVNWMGNYKTLILEFPLPEAIISIFYSIFGYHLFIARIITLLFFAGSAIYLFFIVNYLTDKWVAGISIFVYLLLPLSLFYSRAIHIDFFAIFFAHAMVYHLMCVIKKPILLDLILANFFGVLAFLIKAPYAFFLFILLGFLAIRNYLAIKNGQIITNGLAIRNCLANKNYKKKSFLFLGITAFIVTISFLIWRQYVYVVNSNAPDWNFIPGYTKFIDMNDWYFGSLEIRSNINNWILLIRRFILEIATPIGACLFVLGIIYSFIEMKKQTGTKFISIWLWFLGVVIYILIFFNLNIVHNYYQIPLNAITSIFIAMAFMFILRKLDKIPKYLRIIFSIFIFIIFAVFSIIYAEKTYYKIDQISIDAGDIINAHTPTENCLLIVVTAFPDTDCHDPRVLYHAKRIGWSINLKDMTEDLINNLKKIGATHLAIIYYTGEKQEKNDNSPEWNLYIKEL